MTYTTRAKVEAELRLSAPFSSSTFPTDTQVDVWITELDSYINQLAGRNYASTQYTETLDYNGENEIELENAPVISIDTFNYATKALGNVDYPAFVAKTEDTDFTLYARKGIVTLLSDNFKPELGRKRFEITYTAGYATVPETISMLATKLVAKRAFDSAIQKDINDKESGKSVSVGSISITKTADFGVNQYKIMKDDIESLKTDVLKGKMVHRYISNG